MNVDGSGSLFAIAILMRLSVRVSMFVIALVLPWLFAVRLWFPFSVLCSVSPWKTDYNMTQALLHITYHRSCIIIGCAIMPNIRWSVTHRMKFDGVKIEGLFPARAMDC